MKNYFAIYSQILELINSASTKNIIECDFKIKILNGTNTRGFMTDLSNLDEICNSSNNSEEVEDWVEKTEQSINKNKNDKELKNLLSFSLADKLLFEIKSHAKCWVSIVNLGLSGTTPWLLYNGWVKSNETYWITPQGKLSTSCTPDCLFKPTGLNGKISQIPERIIVFTHEKKLKLKELPVTPAAFVEFCRNIEYYFGKNAWSWKGFAAYLKEN